VLGLNLYTNSMNKYLILVTTLIFSLIFSSCSDDDSPETNTMEMEEMVENDDAPLFAMTAVINGLPFQANDVFGGNGFAFTNIYPWFPMEDFVLLQAREGGVFGAKEINLWLKRSEIVVGSEVIIENSSSLSHFVEIIDNSDNEIEITHEGMIVISEVDLSTKVVKGTFNFKTIIDVDDPTPEIFSTISDGTFHFNYED